MASQKEENDLKKLAILKEKTLKVNRINPNNIQNVFVNDARITHNEDTFFLTFSETEPLFIVTKEELETIATIDAIAKVKLVMTPAFIKLVANLFKNNIDKYEKRYVKNDE